MKKRLIILFVLIFIYYPLNAKGDFKEAWKEKTAGKITKFLAIDINKDGIKEILFRSYSNYSTLHLIEWNGRTFKKLWETNYKEGVNFEYYAFNNFLLIKKYKSKERKVDPHTLLYKDGRYILEKSEEIKMPLWPDESYVSSGSFKKRSAHDVIITGTYQGKREWYPHIRAAKSPYTILWVNLFPIEKRGVQVFGDFNNDKNIELILIPYLAKKGYWIYPKENKFEIKEISSLGNNTTLFPLYPSSPAKYFKVGRTTSKDSDEIFFIEPSWPFAYGSLFKATWQKDGFEFQKILYKGITGYENLNLSDIDNDGIDEIIISKILGDFIQTEEEPDFANRRDVLHILKWDGKEYKKIWTSKPLSAVTAVLVDDVTGDGKKEIIVGNDKGEIHIFGRN